MLCSVSELFGQLLLAVQSIEEAQVEGYQLGPVDLVTKSELNTWFYMSYTLTIRFRLLDLFVWRKDCAGHNCKSMVEVVWLNFFGLQM